MDRRDKKHLFSQDPRIRQMMRNENAGPVVVKDACGTPVEVHDMVHIPTTMFDSPMLIGEVVRLMEPSQLITGQPPQPRMAILQFVIPVPCAPNGTLPWVYVVGQVPGVPQAQPPAQDQQKATEEEGMRLMSEADPDAPKPS